MKFLLALPAILISLFALSQDTLNAYPGDAIVREQIIGKWKDQNSVITFEENGNFKMVWTKKLWDDGTWEIKDKMILFKSRRYKLQKISDLKFRPEAYNIIFFTSNRMSYQLKKVRKDPTIWIADKIGE